MMRRAMAARTAPSTTLTGAGPLCRVDNLVDEGGALREEATSPAPGARPALRYGRLGRPGEDSPYGVARMGLVTDLDVKAKPTRGRLRHRAFADRAKCP